jgi:hypothetical protein
MFGLSWPPRPLRKIEKDSGATASREYIPTSSKDIVGVRIDKGILTVEHGTVTFLANAL